MLSATVVVLALVAAAVGQQVHGSAGAANADTLIQLAKLSGDQFGGFRQSCLLVYKDGRYHRESRRQEHSGGRPSGDWEPPDVFENVLQSADLQRLNEIIESESFRNVAGIFGNPDTLMPSLLSGPRGVTPHTSIEIFEASVAHATHSQLFELLGGATAPKDSALKSFMSWVREIEKAKVVRLDQRAANNCAIPSARTASWEPTTSMAKPTSTPLPDYPSGERDAKHKGTVVVHAIVNFDGSVAAVSVKTALNPVLDRCALDAVRKWTFVPARLAGMAISMPLDVEVRFGEN